MDFLEDFNKELGKVGIEVGASQPPLYWFSTGNHVLNKIISGSFLRGIPQGRIMCYAGPSQSGKSFLAGNAAREAQQQGAHIIVIDSENALDDNFMSALGVDIDNNYTYVPVDTLAQCKKVVSSFVTKYKKEYAGDPEAPKILFVIDSLDMMMTDTEEDHFNQGVTKGDQGQRNKQQKAMLREFVQAIKRLNISMIVTSQVYKSQDTFSQELWVVSEAIKYSLSQVVLLTKWKLKDKTTRQVQGIRMTCEGYKTRFTKPYQSVTIQVPYDTGMDRFNGLLDVAIELGIVTQRGSWYYFGAEKFRRDDFSSSELAPDVLVKCEANREQYLAAKVNRSDLDLGGGQSSKAKRQAKFAATVENDSA